MNLLKSLFDNKWVKKLINLTQNEDKLISSINLDFVDNLFEKQRKTKRGRKRLYKI